MASPWAAVRTSRRVGTRQRSSSTTPSAGGQRPSRSLRVRVLTSARVRAETLARSGKSSSWLVVRVRVSSWRMTGTPSLVSRMSTSTMSVPAAATARMAAMEFSGSATPSPRWATNKTSVQAGSVRQASTKGAGRCRGGAGPGPSSSAAPAQPPATTTETTAPTTETTTRGRVNEGIPKPPRPHEGGQRRSTGSHQRMSRALHQTMRLDGRARSTTMGRTRAFLASAASFSAARTSRKWLTSSTM